MPYIKQWKFLIFFYFSISPVSIINTYQLKSTQLRFNKSVSTVIPALRLSVATLDCISNSRPKGAWWQNVAFQKAKGLKDSPQKNDRLTGKSMNPSTSTGEEKSGNVTLFINF